VSAPAWSWLLELRRLNWTGWVHTEHGTSSTADHAMEVVRRIAEEN
jgi:hypothetical protein